MNPFVTEDNRYKTMLEKALAQLSDSDFFAQTGTHDNSVAVILKHISGNLISRFTDFLTTDGEKSWRNRDSEFQVEKLSRKALEKRWQMARDILQKNVFILTDRDMDRQIEIRGVPFTVREALHFSFHVGQIIFLAKHFTENKWKYLMIPPGQSR